MFCANCGKAVKEGSVFCSNCGKKLENPDPHAAQFPLAAESPDAPEAPAAAAVTEDAVSAAEAPVVPRETVFITEALDVPEAPILAAEAPAVTEALAEPEALEVPELVDVPEISSAASDATVLLDGSEPPKAVEAPATPEETPVVEKLFDDSNIPIIPEVPVQPAPEPPVKIRTGFRSTLLSILLVLNGLVTLVAAFFRGLAMGSDFPRFLIFDGDTVTQFFSSIYPLAIFGAVCTILILDLLLINLRRIRRFFLALGISSIVGGALTVAFGFTYGMLLPLLYSEWQDYLANTVPAFRTLTFPVGAVLAGAGALLLCVYFCIRAIRGQRPPKRAQASGAAKTLTLVTNLVFVVFLAVMIVLVVLMLLGIELF